MTAALYILIDPALDGPTNMARDEALLYADALGPAIVRIYRWTPPTISLGYFQRAADVGALPADVRGLSLVRRPTGGGAILHDREITYCLVLHDEVPLARQAPAALYRVVHECWRDAILSTGVRSELAPEHFPLPTPRSGPFFCFEKPGRTDLIVGGEKLLGSAQRRIPGRVLQHGSLLLGRRYISHPGADLGEPRGEVVEAWINEFLGRLAAALALCAARAEWTHDLLADAARRRERYASVAWNCRR
jgi:lipoate-protein ligase A